MTHQNLSLGKCWKLFGATLTLDNFSLSSQQLVLSYILYPGI